MFFSIFCEDGVSILIICEQTSYLCLYIRKSKSVYLLVEKKTKAFLSAEEIR